MTDEKRELSDEVARQIENEARPPGDIREALFDDGFGGAVQIAVRLKGRKLGKGWRLETDLHSLTAAIKRAVQTVDGALLELIEHPDLRRKGHHRGDTTLVHIRAA